MKNQEDIALKPKLPPLVILDPQLIFTIDLKLRNLAAHGHGSQIIMY